ncbi:MULTISPECIES: thioredoxin family protein [Stenotrophomonas]|uniref:thioredoxin family protein n=1 Tax=Stenotrophomonas TaxID=40323 RepID=UPI001CF3118B|nr:MULTISPECIES: thioredoxin family protein [Stenotrophomonas]MCA7024770.1 thioredoxin family protein [Stenotrophomonas acidaminiphila]MCE4074472.1 thioredoxin family protein [Stenotrophomonas acidaminiphila]
MRHIHALLATAALAATVPATDAMAAATPTPSPAMTMAMAPGVAIRAYDQMAFDQAQAANKPILVWVHAPWCPVCREQEKAIKEITADPAYRDLVVLRIDFDTQKPLWQKFGATMQSTLIGFHGKRETGRVAHESDLARVAPVLRSTLSGS